MIAIGEPANQRPSPVFREFREMSDGGPDNLFSELSAESVPT